MDFNDLQSDKLPQIDIKDKNLPLITKRAWDALIASNSQPYLFTYGNHIVRSLSDCYCRFCRKIAYWAIYLAQPICLQAFEFM
jgi:hypothetical protein